jgi:hypothetical protein
MLLPRSDSESRSKIVTNLILLVRGLKAKLLENEDDIQETMLTTPRNIPEDLHL